MFGDTGMIQYSIAHSVNNQARDPKVLRRHAAQRFLSGRFIAIRRQLWAKLTGRDMQLLNLKTYEKRMGIHNRRHDGIQQVPIQQIKGSEGRTLDFDSQFRPRKGHMQDRWVNVAVAWLMGIPLPPVDLVKVGSSYFVRDGHHRISVAQSLGQATIDADVTIWELA